jgi:PAS domain S-box-containing protein
VSRGGTRHDTCSGVSNHGVRPQGRAEAARRESEERCRLIVEEARDYAILTMRPDGVVDSWSPGAESIFGWRAAEIIGRPVQVTFTPEDRAAGVPEREMATARVEGVAPDVRWHLRKDGARVLVDGTTRALRDDEGGLRCFLKIGQDVTRLRETEARVRDDQRVALDEVERHVGERTRELAAANAALELAARERDALRRELTSAEEAERRRLARELHDQLGQHLTAFALGLAEARRLPDVGQSMAERLAQLEGLANLMTRDARYLALELRPPELDDVGFESALQTYVQQWAERYGVAAELAITGADAKRPLPPDVGTALYRIAQEALTNVAKHAAATQVSILVDKPEGSARLVVEDNGHGFEPEATAKRVRKERRLGMAGMRERAALAGGTVEVESSPGRGTTVYVRVALEHGQGPGEPAARGDGE